jgi:hypothetical protein
LLAAGSSIGGSDAKGEILCDAAFRGEGLKLIRFPDVDQIQGEAQFDQHGLEGAAEERMEYSSLNL